jgi:Na+/proline symporter
MSLNSSVPFDTGGIFHTFQWLDFVFFGLMLGSSTLIGVYFGFCGKKEDTPKEYLHGGKTMGTIPVAVSLVSRSVTETLLRTLNHIL